MTSASHIAEESQNKQLQEKLKEAKVALKEYDQMNKQFQLLQMKLKN